MPRRRDEEFAAATTWCVVTIESTDGDTRHLLDMSDTQGQAREHYAWLIQACTRSVVLLQARDSEDDDWITIERYGDAALDGTNPA